jgi:hypothetical protein
VAPIAPVWDSRLLVEEITAAVLGAHIDGRVRTLQGGDGAALTHRRVAEYRDQCDLSSNTSIRRLVWVVAMRIGIENLDQDALQSIAAWVPRITL